jgi:hypothetical protein
MTKIENWQSMKLTKGQQELVADNEIVIRVVFNKIARQYNLTEPYDNFYSDAAIYLCKAAIYAFIRRSKRVPLSRLLCDTVLYLLSNSLKVIGLCPHLSASIILFYAFTINACLSNRSEILCHDN